MPDLDDALVALEVTRGISASADAAWAAAANEKGTQTAAGAAYVASTDSIRERLEASAESACDALGVAVEHALTPFLAAIEEAIEASDAFVVARGTGRELGQAFNVLLSPDKEGGADAGAFGTITAFFAVRDRGRAARGVLDEAERQATAAIHTAIAAVLATLDRAYEAARTAYMSALDVGPRPASSWRSGGRAARAVYRVAVDAFAAFVDAVETLVRIVASKSVDALEGLVGSAANARMANVRAFAGFGESS